MKSRFFALALAALVVVACNGNKPAVKKMTVGNDSKDDQKFAYMLGAQFGAQFAAIAAQVLPPAPPPSASSIQYTVDQWKRLQQSDRWPFTDYANFMLAHPGWPGGWMRWLRARRRFRRPWS